MAGTRFTGLAFAAPGGNFNDEILVHVFLRGGMDGLNVVMPMSGSDRGFYEAARPDLRVPTSGADGAVSLASGFGLHPSAAQWLHPLYQDGKLAVVVAAGLDEANRSHFDAQEYMDRGTPGNRTTSTGWLARHLASADNLPEEIVMPSLSVGSTQATSLLGDHDTINLSDPDGFNLDIGPWAWRDAQRRSLRTFYSSDSTWLHTSGLQALDAMDLIELNASGSYTPGNGAVYPSNSFGDALQVVAQMVKLDLGLRVAALDLGGWDTHNGQGDGSGGYFAGLLETLAQGMAALYTDFDGTGRVSSVGVSVRMPTAAQITATATSCSCCRGMRLVVSTVCGRASPPARSSTRRTSQSPPTFGGYFPRSSSGEWETTTSGSSFPNTPDTHRSVW
jgi:uncharacterized protein (DUF1501 family)